MKKRKVKNTKRKGDKRVLEIVKELKEAGIACKKTSMSGQLSDKGDIWVWYKDDFGTERELRIEVKARKKLSKFWKELLKENDIVIFVEDYSKKKVCLISFELLKELLK